MMNYQHNKTLTKSRSQLSKIYLCLLILSLQLSSFINAKQLKYSQQGSVLIYLIVVIVVAGALGAGIVSMTTTSTFTELTYNPSDQARFLAMSGLDYARTTGQSGDFFLAEQGNSFRIERDGEDITVVATVYEDTAFEASFKLSGSGSEPTNGFGLVTREDIDLTGSSKIIGNVKTVSGDVSLGWSTIIDGDLLVRQDSTVTMRNPNSVTGEITHIENEEDFCSFSRDPQDDCNDLCLFPNGCTDFTTTWSDTNITLEDGDCFNIIDIKSNRTLDVDVGDTDRILYIGSLNPSGSNGHLRLNPAPGTNGSGSLVLYIQNSINLTGSSSINQNSNASKLILYYAATEDFDIGSNTRFNGAIYAPYAELKMTGSSEHRGYIEAESFLGSGNIRFYSEYHESFDGYCGADNGGPGP